MTAPATFDDRVVEALIAARDADRRSVDESAAITQQTTAVLATLDDELAKQIAHEAQLERIRSYLYTFIEWARQNDWPGFHTMPVVVGTKLEPIWRGLLGQREVPDIHSRGVYVQMSLGLTTRGEFIYNGRAIGQTPHIIDVHHPRFCAARFEAMLIELLRHHNIPS